MIVKQIHPRYVNALIVTIRGELLTASRCSQGRAFPSRSLTWGQPRTTPVLPRIAMLLDLHTAGENNQMDDREDSYKEKYNRVRKKRLSGEKFRKTRRPRKTDFQLRKQLNNLEFHKLTYLQTDRHLALFSFISSCGVIGIQGFKDLGI